MDVLEAISSRKSIRAFTDQAVSRQTVEQLLEISQRAPSGTNTQPWHVYVCAGEVRQAITDDVLAMAARGESSGYEDGGRNDSRMQTQDAASAGLQG